MNDAFSAYTPRVFPLGYDALALKEGCETDSGYDYFGTLAFTRVCIAPFDSADPLYNKPDTAAYFYGPAATGSGVKPFLTGWAAWVATQGIRIGQESLVVPPANTTGTASALYNNTTPAKLTGAYGRGGLLALAIQKTAAAIELKQYTDDTGTIAAYTWTGISPALFYNGLLAHNEPPVDGLVCYYLRPERPTILYARFSADGWATEHVVMPELRTPLVRLLDVRPEGLKAVLRAVDDLGRGVTLYTAQYAAKATEAAVVDISFVSGGYFATGVNAPPQADSSVLDITLASGLYFDAVVESAAQPPQEACGVAIALDGGEYT